MTLVNGETMSFICGDCKQQHPVPTPEEDLAGTPCFDALARDRNSLLLQNRALIEILTGGYHQGMNGLVVDRNAAQIALYPAAAQIDDERRGAEKPKPETAICREWVMGVGPCVAYVPCEVHKKKPSEGSPKKDNRCTTCCGSGLAPGWDVIEKRVEGSSKCPGCGLGVTGVDALCERHYSEYLGQNRARGNGPGD